MKKYLFILLTLLLFSCSTNIEDYEIPIVKEIMADIKENPDEWKFTKNDNTNWDLTKKNIKIEYSNEWRFYIWIDNNYFYMGKGIFGGGRLFRKMRRIFDEKIEVYSKEEMENIKKRLNKGVKTLNIESEVETEVVETEVETEVEPEVQLEEDPNYSF